MDSRRMERLRKIIARVLDDLGMPDAAYSLVVETNPYRDRDHMIRGARGGGLRAVWVVPSRAIEIYAEDGSLLRRVVLVARLEAA
jgi:hypothetical protein